MDSPKKKQITEEYEPRIFHLRFGVILTDHKTLRYIIVRIDTEDYPLVFLREWIEDSYDEGDYYTLYGNALTDTQADEILDQIKAGDTRSARTLLKRYFKADDPYISDVGPVMLDDYIPDEWYDVWKEMEGIITSTHHIDGYWEMDVKEKMPL